MQVIAGRLVLMFLLFHGGSNVIRWEPYVKEQQNDGQPTRENLIETFKIGNLQEKSSK